MNLNQLKISTFILLILITVFGIFDAVNSFFIPINLPEEKEIQIQEGQGARDISQILHESGVIKNRRWFEVYVLLSGKRKELKAGKYLFSGRVTLNDAAKKIIRGDSLSDYGLLVPEGYTLYDIDKRLAQELKNIEKSSFSKAAVSYDNSSGQWEFLPANKNLNLEGYLFPDTYRIKYGSKPEEIIEKMLDNFNKKVWAEYKSRNFSEHITMASIIEREVPNPEEMKIVSGILWKRLKIDMALEADATLYYFKCYLKIPQDCGAVINGDKEVNSGYNTYLYTGFPAGPISNPGLNAIEAAFNPVSSPYLYYLSAKDDGRTIFAKTLDEHTQNIYKYR